MKVIKEIKARRVIQVLMDDKGLLVKKVYKDLSGIK
jgi:hypothetical protein